MACKTKFGTYRVDLVLPEPDYLAFEAIAKDAGVSVADVIRMKLKGFEPRRAA